MACASLTAPRAVARASTSLDAVVIIHSRSFLVWRSRRSTNDLANSSVMSISAFPVVKVSEGPGSGNSFCGTSSLSIGRGWRDQVHGGRAARPGELTPARDAIAVNFGLVHLENDHLANHPPAGGVGVAIRRCIHRPRPPRHPSCRNFPPTAGSRPLARSRQTARSGRSVGRGPIQS